MSGEEEANLPPASEKFKIDPVKNSDVKVTHRYTLGDTSTMTLCVRYDPNDKYIATGCFDGSIRIYNVFTGKQSYTLNADGEEHMPITNIKWRPLCAPGVTKNVIIAASADGTLKHWHTTSGRLLNTTFNEDHKTKTCDYKPDGTAFLTADDDFIIRVYDE